MHSYLSKFKFGALLSAGLLSFQLNAMPTPRFAIVRELSDTFENSLKLSPEPVLIDMSLAKEQHENYIGALKRLIKVIKLKADSSFPDCNFIEDTAIIVGDVAVISRMGAPEREGEEIVVAKALTQLKFLNIVHLQSPAKMDGGDILFTGKHLFVGLSKRTNKFALDQLKQIFKNKYDVIGIPVTEGLHLKSVISLFDEETLIVADTHAGREVQKNINESTDYSYTFVPVPDVIASNVLRIGPFVLIQEGFSESEEILQALADTKQVNIIKLNMSELIKADGALTCGSLLIE